MTRSRQDHWAKVAIKITKQDCQTQLLSFLLRGQEVTPKIITINKMAQKIHLHLVLLAYLVR